MLPDSSTRLNKYISESGICSRREADRFIEQGNVFINGKRATIGDQVKAGDVVKVNGRLIEPREADDLVLIALNKPVGIWIILITVRQISIFSQDSGYAVSSVI